MTFQGKPDPWWDDVPLYIKEREAINEIKECLVPIELTEFRDGKHLWQSMKRMFEHKHSDHLILRAIAGTRFYTMLIKELEDDHTD